MSEHRWPPREKVVDGIYSRLAFEDRPVTKYLVLVILLWYLVEIGALVQGWSLDRLQWLFTTKSFPALSPGLFFASISHAPPPNVTHILSNVAGLWLIAGESEQHMNKLEVIGFFIVSAQISVLASSALTGETTMGASGGVLAFVGFYAIHMLLKHRQELDLDTIKTPRPTETPIRAYGGVILILLPIVFLPYFIGQLLGVIPTGQSDVIGHLTGMLMGMAYALTRSRSRNSRE